MTYKLGLDTGGTYTDAVILDENFNIVASAKSLTTHQDLSEGLRGAIAEASSGYSASISLVSLSTTLATNALVEGRGKPCALFLIGYTEKQFVRARLNEALSGDPLVMIDGGHDANGNTVQALDMTALDEAVNTCRHQVEAFAVSAMFGTRNPGHEIKARDRIRELTGMPVTCGHELSTALDAPRRALTAVLNARLIPLIKSLLDATVLILEEFSISAPLMVVKGDGSLVSRNFAENSPVETILSGPAASVVAAQFMSGKENLLVSDMGGTTTDIAILNKGRPKLDSLGATVGGWRSMVKAVKINTCGLGGDSAIRFDREQRDLSIGPDRVKPLALLVDEHPDLLEFLKAQIDSGYVNTHAGQFVVRNTAIDDLTGLSLQQKELWEKIADRPIAMQSLFEDQTLDRALRTLIRRGLVLLSGFTPTDASHILGQQRDWNSEASRKGAELMMWYSNFNLGRTYSSVEEFAQYVHETVARMTAIVMLESALAEHSGQSGLALPIAERNFIQKAFHSDATHPVDLQVSLKLPVMGIGAPASSYYPRVGELLATRVILPEYASVANAVGAVVGTVHQSLSLTITPAGGKRVQVHTANGPLAFDTLEMAVEWATADINQRIGVQVIAAGATNYELTLERKDNVVDNNGDKVFFESTITVHASGRPASVESA